jgi:Xaa-Pro dipeptidase
MKREQLVKETNYSMSVEIIQKQRAAMRERNLDALVIASPENIAYSADVVVPSQAIVRHRLVFCLVPCEGAPEIIAVNIEESFVKSNSSIEQVIAYNEFTEDPVQVLADCLHTAGLGNGRIGIEYTALSIKSYETLRRALPQAALIPIDDLLQHLRLIKTPGELQKLRQIGRTAERAARAAFEQARVGMTEVELGQLITEAYLANGGDRLTMLVVGAGERSGFANAAPTRRPLQNGDIVRVDVIGTGDNYYSDVARTAVIGRATDEQLRAWSYLVEARKVALDAMRPGASTRAMYRRYAEQMERWNLPPIKFLGHGLGLTLHEEPYIGPYTDIQLQPGMVMCIEPLCWYPERWGVQLEDEVILTEDGYELITDQYDESELYVIPA